MFDAASRSDPATAALPRAEGAIAIAVKHDGTRTRLARLRHQGSAKCLLPRGTPAPEAVIVNTAGGITGGDRFDWRAEAGPDCTLTCTTQAAERIYRASGEAVGHMRTHLTLGPRATLAWLPQETILFDRGAFERSLTVEMAPDATLLLLEPLVLGRAAMGETVHQGHFVDRWEIRREGRLVFADTLRLSGPIAEIAARPAVLGGARATANLLLVAPDAEDRLDALRAALDAAMARDSGFEAGASAWNGLLAARLIATGGMALRDGVIASLTALKIVGLPRVWHG
ncbi:MAG: urease accessory protein UreD [Pseudomonadota bacterium]